MIKIANEYKRQADVSKIPPSPADEHDIINIALTRHLPPYLYVNKHRTDGPTGGQYEKFF